MDIGTVLILYILNWTTWYTYPGFFSRIMSSVSLFEYTYPECNQRAFHSRVLILSVDFIGSTGFACWLMFVCLIICNKTSVFPFRPFRNGVQQEPLQRHNVGRLLFTPVQCISDNIHGWGVYEEQKEKFFSKHALLEQNLSIL